MYVKATSRANKDGTAGRRPARAGRPAFDLLAAKLLRPLVRPGTVRRSSLVDRLARDVPYPIVSVVAPAGCGKTTLLAQWAERNGQAFAWGVARRAGQRPEGVAQLRRRGAGCGRASGRAGVRRAGLGGQFGARVGGAAAGRGSGVDDRSGGAGCSTTCTCCATPRAGPRCRCCLIMYRPGRGWCSPGAPSRRCGSRCCAPRTRSSRSARVTCR
jgi:hypothetical protein